MMTRHKQVALKISELSKAGTFEGLGAVFGNKDAYGDIIMPGAFKETLEEKMPAMLWQHKSDEPIGAFKKAQEVEEGLFVKGELLIEDDPLAKRAHAHLKAGSLSGMSIGYSFDDKDDWEFDKEKEAFLIHKVNLWEVSLVTFPANDLARVQDVKSAFMRGDLPTRRGVERVLRDAGFSIRQAKAFLAEGYSAIDDRDGSDCAELVESLKLLNNIVRT